MKNLITDRIVWQNFESESFLETDSFHIFKISIDVYEIIKNEYSAILQENELKRAEKFRQFDDLKRFIVGKFFSKTLLAKQTGLKASEITFSFTEFNKPFFKNYHFNVSHSGNFVVIIFGPLPVGIDIELIKENFEYESLLPECFNKTEIEKINNVIDFYTFWTKKESLLKATAEGLTDNLNAIDCSMDYVTRFDSVYKLISHKIEDNYSLSIAAKSSNYPYKYWTVKY